MRVLPWILAVAALLSAAPGRLSAQSYVVIVNEANEVTGVSASDLSDMFLKKSRRWPNGQDAVPVDLPPNSATREAFSQGVHGKSTNAIKAYWQKMIFSGKAVPPVEKTVDAEVIAYVRATPGAVGYVSAGATLSGVRRISVR